MKNWGNWSYGELLEVIESGKAKGEEVVVINQSHTDWENDKKVQEWLTELGLKFIVGDERTDIFIK